MRPSKAQTGESMDRPNIIQDEDINVSSPNNQQPESVGRHFAAIPAPSVSGLDEERCRESPLTTQSKATENASDIPESILLQQNTRVSHLQIGSSDDSIKNESDLKPDQAGGDRSFKVSPLQSIELASATFGGSYRIPLTLYYATDELRVRGDICTVIDELFQENWDEKDEAFDALVEVFNTRPFKQDLYFSAADSVQHCVLTASAVRGTPGSSELDTLVQSLGMEPALSYLPEQETGLRGESPPEITAANAIPNVASKDLSRIILRFLSDLPHPLIPDDVFTAFSDTIRLQTADPIKIQMSSLLVQSLPDEQQQLLQFLLEFLDDIILKPLQDHIQVCEHASSDVADRDDGHKEKMQLYKKTIARISEVFGIVCTHATTSELSGSMSHTMETPIESSLYRYYKVMSERKGIQEKLATVVNKAQTVFHYLLQNRVGIFGSFSFSLHSLGATGHPAKRIGASDIDTNGQGEDVNEALLCKCDDDTNYGHQSDNAYLDRPTTLLESRERQYQKSGSCANQCPCKPAGRSRHFHKCAIQGKAFAQRVVEPTTAISDTGNIGDDMPSSRPNATCDSAMEETVIVDTLAEAAMRVHAAQSLRLQRHLPHPSLETLHSIMAETDSIMGVLDQKQCEDQHGGNEEKQKTKFGLESTDSPQGSTNRKRQEHEIRIVEKEILQSELTTQFLTANLGSLYPSSSPASIPPEILPSVRTMLAHQAMFTAAKTKASQTVPTSLGTIDQPEETLQPRMRELKWTAHRQIELPANHCATESCSCSFCTAEIKPSSIPVLTRTEYELAELRSQCDGKDRHVAELLQMVHTLQGQVNVLNAKLLFLHDHHTTRPMRRRILARHSYPVNNSAITSASSSRAEFLPRPAIPSLFGVSSAEDSTSSLGELLTNADADRDLTRMCGGPDSFTEGVSISNNSEARLIESRVSQQNVSSTGMLDVEALELSETMSSLSHDNNPSSVHLTGHTRYERYETEIERVLREMDEAEEEPEREGQDTLDKYYYMDAYKTMDQQLHRRPILPVPVAPRPMSGEVYKKTHRMSLPIQALMSKRISLGGSFRWRGRGSAV